MFNFDIAATFASPETQIALFAFLIIVIISAAIWFWKLMADKAYLHYSLRLVFLKVQIPRYQDDGKNQQTDEKKDMKATLSVMEQFFTVLHNAIPKTKTDILTGRQSFAVEMVAKDGELSLYFVMPHVLQGLVEKQITSYYSQAVVERVSDPNIFFENSKAVAGYFKLKKPSFYPIRTFQHLEYDPLNNLANAFSKLTDEDSATLQIMFSPANDNWRKAGKKKARDIFEGKKGDHSLPVQILIWFMKILTLQINDLGDKKDGDKRDYRVTPKEEEQVKALEEKASEVGFRCVMRLISVSSHEFKAEANLGMIANAFSQYNEPDLNEFKFISPSGFGKERKIRQIIEKYLFRYLHRTDPVMILNTEELASIFHLPDSRYNTAPVIKWQNSRIAPPPQNIPKEGIILGDSFYRGQHTLVRISHEDRFRHFYIIGQTGTGKSVGLTNMILQDMKAGFGLCVMDPHGSLAKDVMEYIPRERAEDVIYFNPADTSRPLGLNLLEAETVEEKDLVAMDALNIMIKLYGEEIFSPRLQDYFRNGVLTLMDDEKEGGSLIDVVPLFTSPVFQKYKRTKVKNPVVKSWWNDTYDSMGDREKEEMIPYFAAKFGAFVTNTTMRNVLGQAKSAFDFGEAMQNNKLILVNLSKGLIGELNSNLLGMIIVSKIQMAAMRRESIPKQNRKDFFFYIDEFQNFITESIESILSEARKYRLGMVMANQYIAQLTDKGGDRSIGDKIKNAVFGNVGTLWSYKVSAEDAEYLEKEFSPVFNQRDLNNLDIFHACLKLTINGVQTPPFSIVARKPWELEEFQKMKNPEKVTNAIKELARLQWGKDKKFVEAEILGRLGI